LSYSWEFGDNLLENLENLELSMCVLAACSLAGAAFVVAGRISDV